MSQKLKDDFGSSDAPVAVVGSRVQANAADVAGFDERIRSTLLAAADKKALDLTVLDLHDIASFTDFFVIATGTNRRQVQAISDEVVEQLKRKGTRAAPVEGFQTAEWILIDYGDSVGYIFEDKARRFYDLERLWREAKRIDVSPELLESEK